MATTGKKKSPDKGKKKTSTPSKSRAKTKVKDDVCTIEDTLLTEQLFCCFDECGCPI